MHQSSQDYTPSTRRIQSRANKGLFNWKTWLAISVFSIGQVAQADIGATHTSMVSEFASFNTPGVVDGRVEAIAIDGDTVFVGGTFTQIHDPLSNEIVDQPYLFAYSKSSGDIIRDFDPILNNVVLALETTGDGTGVFAGGVFNVINGESNRRGIVKIDDNGDRVAGFGARADALVKTLVRFEDTLYLGGNFASISGTPVEHLAAIDTTTGAVDPNLNFDFDGRIFTHVTPNAVQSVEDIDITSDGQLMVIIGNFQSIDSISRTRLAVIELDGQASVSTWNTDVYDVQCPVLRLPQYIRGVDIAPDDSYFVVGSQGFRRRAEPACDTTVRFDFNDLTDTDVQPTWVNYTGGDSVYEVVATDHAIYIGGHFEFVTNDLGGGNHRGPGGQPRRGLAALDPLNGLTLLDWRSDRNPRGVGVFAMIAEPEGLYLGDDTDFLNGTEHKKLKFLPITNNVISRPDVPTLPTTIVTNYGSGVSGLDGSSFDGITIGAPTQLASTEFGSGSAAMFVGGQLFYANTQGEMRVRTLADGILGPMSVVDLFGLNENHWALSQLGGMFFDYEWSRVYYTIQGDSRLFYRGFSPDGTYFGNDIGVAEQPGDVLWSDVTSMDAIDGYLYFSRTDGNLYRAELDGAAVVSGTTEQIGGPAIDGRNWDNTLLAFLGDGVIINPRNNDNPGIEFQASGDSEGNGRFRNFDFPVVAGEPVLLRLEWLDSDADLRLFVRDANGVLVASDTTAAGSPKFLTVPAGDGGTYTAAVLVASGSTSYILEVNPDDAPPEPLADFEFSSAGDQNSGRFQVFDFDVVAGELVEALILWDDPTADVRVFLRDETNSQIDNDTDGAGSAAVSTIAASSGQWSIAVLIRSGSTDYDILVDTTDDFVVPQPLADFEFSSSGTDESANGRFQSFEFNVVAGETIDIQLNWDDLNADVRLFLRDENGAQIARNVDGVGSAAVSTVATSGGTWSAAVLVRTATDIVHYDLLVNAN